MDIRLVRTLDLQLKSTEQVEHFLFGLTVAELLTSLESARKVQLENQFVLPLPKLIILRKVRTNMDLLAKVQLNSKQTAKDSTWD